LSIQAMGGNDHTATSRRKLDELLVTIQRA